MLRRLLYTLAKYVDTNGSTAQRRVERKRYPAKYGIREDLPEVGKPFKSSMEANVYRFYKTRKLDEVQYEPERFYFRNNRFDIQSYVPDFKIRSGKRIWYVEVKGYPELRDYQKIILLKEQYHWIKIYIVGPKQYAAIFRNYGYRTPGWE